MLTAILLWHYIRDSIVSISDRAVSMQVTFVSIFFHAPEFMSTSSRRKLCFDVVDAWVLDNVTLYT